MSDSKSFLGTGWSFPPSFSPGGASLEMVSDIKDIQQSLEILFGTRLGERIMQEDYGSSLIDYQFEEVSSFVINRLQHMIEEAILYHEARITLNTLNIRQDDTIDGLLLIQLDFSIPASNSRYNMVYPFYLNESSQ
ncbi:MAG: GPW/gp25 family protein [Bacteroidota bacterium]